MNTRKILINSCYGGFGLSDAAIEKYLTKKNVPFTTQHYKSWLSARKIDFYVGNEIFSIYDIERDDPLLIETVIELGINEASDSHAELKIVEIPVDIEWQLCEYDGKEWVAEKHRIWE